MQKRLALRYGSGLVTADATHGEGPTLSPARSGPREGKAMDPRPHGPAETRFERKSITANYPDCREKDL